MDGGELFLVIEPGGVIYFVGMDCFPCLNPGDGLRWVGGGLFPVFEPGDVVYCDGMDCFLCLNPVVWRWDGVPAVGMAGSRGTRELHPLTCSEQDATMPTCSEQDATMTTCSEQDVTTHSPTTYSNAEQ